MIEKFKVLNVKAAPFQGDGGERIDWYYTKLLRLSNEVTIEAGGRDNLTSEIGKEIELDFEKIEKNDGGFRYKILGRSN